MLKKGFSMIIATVTVLCMVLSLLSACGQKNQQNPVDSQPSSAKEERNAEPKTADSKKYIFKLAHHEALDHPIQKAAEEFAKLAAEKSNEQIEIKVFGGGQLGGLKDNTEGVRYGTIEMAWLDLSAIASIYPKAGVIGLPFLFRDYDHAHKFFDGEVGKKLADEIVRETGIRILKYSDSGFRSIISQKPITTPDDMKDMKIRVPEVSVYVQTFKAIGTNPTPIPLGEVYTALQTGVVDAMECPVDTLYIRKMYEVTKYIARTNHCYADIDLGINDKIYQSLPEDIRKAIDEAAEEAINNHRRMFIEQEDNYFKKLVDSGLEESKADAKAFTSKVQAVWNDFAKKTDSQDLIDSIINIK